jgi:hypothetical protein
MAWIDDRIWCHPKFTSLSARAFRGYIHGIAYAAGMGTRGHLTAEQQRIIGVRSVIRKELISARLWTPDGDNDEDAIVIHDWDDHNAKRDQRRADDRERKRLARAKEREEARGASAGQGADSPPDVPQDSPQDVEGDVRRTDPGQNVGPARVDGSEGSEGSEVLTRAVALDPTVRAPDNATASDLDDEPTANGPGLDDEEELEEQPTPETLERINQLLAQAALQDMEHA